MASNPVGNDWLLSSFRSLSCAIISARISRTGYMIRQQHRSGLDYRLGGEVGTDLGHRLVVDGDEVDRRRVDSQALVKVQSCLSRLGSCITDWALASLFNRVPTMRPCDHAAMRADNSRSIEACSPIATCSMKYASFSSTLVGNPSSLAMSTASRTARSCFADSCLASSFSERDCCLSFRRSRLLKSGWARLRWSK